MNTEHTPDTTALARGLGLNRRQFLAATTGMAAAAAVSAGPLASTAAAAPGGGNGVVVPPGKRGIILYTVRDAVSRDPNTSPFASGFKEVFEELSRIGYKQIEFAGYGQHANAPGGQRQQRRRSPPAPVLARRQRARGRGQPRQHPVDDHRRGPRPVRRRLRSGQHPWDGSHRHWR